jgi:hypothetical protein
MHPLLAPSTDWRSPHGRLQPQSSTRCGRARPGHRYGRRLRFRSFFIRARRPHQQGEIIGIAGVDIDILRQQPLHDVELSAGRRIDDRRLAGFVGRSRVGSSSEQRFDDRIVAGIGGRRDRRDPAAPGELDVGASPISWWPCGSQDRPPQLAASFISSQACDVAY